MITKIVVPVAKPFTRQKIKPVVRHKDPRKTRKIKHKNMCCNA